MTEHASGEININSKMSKVLEILLELDEYPSWIQDIISIDVHSRDSQGRAILATMKTSLRFIRDSKKASCTLNWLLHFI